MSMVKAKCPACGVLIDVEDVNGAAVCSHCATPFVVANAVEAYAHSSHSQTLEMGIQNGNSFLQLKEWRKAYDVFTELSNNYPHDARTWFGIARAISHEKACHEITSSMLQAIKNNIEKARTLNMYIVDNSWDVYIENEEDRLNREAQQKEMQRRKLQREYDEVVDRSHRQLGTIVANKKAMRSTYMTLGGILMALGGGLVAAWFLKYLPHLWYLYIAGGLGGVGILLFILGLCSSLKKASLPGADIEDIKKTVERIQQSAKRSGVEIDMSHKVKTYIAPPAKK